LHHPVARPSENLAEFVAIPASRLQFTPAGIRRPGCFEDWEKRRVDAIDDDDDTGVAP